MSKNPRRSAATTKRSPAPPARADRPPLTAWWPLVGAVVLAGGGVMAVLLPRLL